MFFGGPLDGQRQHIERGPGNAPPPELHIAGDNAPSYTQATEAVDSAPCPPTGVYARTGGRQTELANEACYEWRGWR